MRLLQHSCEAKQDRAQLFASLVLFWLMAAIDGHAKNFSVFIEAEGRFRLTPLYDILSAHPLIASQQVERQKIKMAMALHGKNRHYHWHSLQPRHFFSMAERVGLPVKTARDLFNDMLERVDRVIAAVQATLPPDFPEAIAVPIFTGMRDRRDVGMRGV